MNLLDNAVKYSEPGTPILIGLARRENEIALKIEDHGSGFSAEALPHLFEAFFRTKETRRQGISGVGLGLSIAARLAEALDGRIDAESQNGKGSCFTVIFPEAR